VLPAERQPSLRESSGRYVDARDCRSTASCPTSTRPRVRARARQRAAGRALDGGRQRRGRARTRPAVLSLLPALNEAFDIATQAHRPRTGIRRSRCRRAAWRSRCCRPSWWATACRERQRRADSTWTLRACTRDRDLRDHRPRFPRLRPDPARPTSTAPIPWPATPA
jgi:hypothetical protein